MTNKLLEIIISAASIVITICCGFFIYSSLNSLVIDQDKITQKYNPLLITNQKYEPIIGLVIDNSFFCSGVVIDSHYALTAAHCVDSFLGGMNRNEISIIDINKNYTNVTARAVAMNKLNDVALLKGDFSLFNNAAVDFKGSYVHNINNLQTVSCGFPHGGSFFCSVGRLSNNMEFRLLGRQFVLQKGMSGGPLIRSFSPTEFVVIGINSSVGEDYTVFGSLVGLDSLFGIE